MERSRNYVFLSPPGAADIYTLSLHDALPICYSNFSQPQSHLSFCVLLQYLVERRRVVTQLLKQNRSEERFSRNAETEFVCRLTLGTISISPTTSMSNARSDLVGAACLASTTT